MRKRIVQHAAAPSAAADHAAKADLRLDPVDLAATAGRVHRVAPAVLLAAPADHVPADHAALAARAAHAARAGHVGPAVHVGLAAPVAARALAAHVVLAAPAVLAGPGPAGLAGPAGRAGLAAPVGLVDPAAHAPVVRVVHVAHAALSRVRKNA